MNRSRQEGARCLRTDPEAFFAEDQAQLGAAKSICARCPVRTRCLDVALARNEMFGIWGGLSRQERAALKRGRTTLGGVA